MPDREQVRDGRWLVWRRARARRVDGVLKQNDNPRLVYVQYTCSPNGAVSAIRGERIDDERESDGLLEASEIESGDAGGDREGGSA